MKINWKILVALVLLFGAIFWAVESVRARAYSGNNLNVDIGSGPVTVTNPSDQPVPVQLLGTGTRSFSVSSTIDGVTGSSVRQGAGRSATHLFEFALPPGVSTFTVVRGSDVNLVANVGTNLQASVQPLNADETRSTLIAAIVVVLGALFYVSRATDHRWISRLRGKQTAAPVAAPLATPGIQSSGFRPYGDNRANVVH